MAGLHALPLAGPLPRAARLGAFKVARCVSSFAARCAHGLQPPGREPGTLPRGAWPLEALDRRGGPPASDPTEVAAVLRPADSASALVARTGRATPGRLNMPPIIGKPAPRRPPLPRGHPCTAPAIGTSKPRRVYKQEGRFPTHRAHGKADLGGGVRHFAVCVRCLSCESLGLQESGG